MQARTVIFNRAVDHLSFKIRRAGTLQHQLSPDPANLDKF